MKQISYYMQKLKEQSFSIPLFLILGILGCALFLRLSLFSHCGLDCIVYVKWYDFIKLHQGLHVFSYNFADYNVPYLYLLLLATHIPLQKVIAIKTFSLLFDGLLAFFIYKIVREKLKREYAFLAAVCVLFLPTVFVNSAYWGQTDSIYASFILASLYAFIKERSFLGILFYSIAFVIKPQAIFFFPVIFILFLLGKIRIKDFLAPILVYLTFSIPTLIAGRSIFYIVDLFKLQSHLFPGLAYNSPNFAIWIYATYHEWGRALLIFTTGIVLIISYIVYLSKKPLTNGLLIQLSLLFTLLMPFFMPGMHDRYTYLAEILSVIYAFYYPKLFIVPILIQVASFIVYMNVLFQLAIISPQILAFFMLAAIIIVARKLYSELF